MLPPVHPHRRRCRSVVRLYLSTGYCQLTTGCTDSRLQRHTLVGWARLLHFRPVVYSEDAKQMLRGAAGHDLVEKGFSSTIYWLPVYCGPAGNRYPESMRFISEMTPSRSSRVGCS